MKKVLALLVALLLVVPLFSLGTAGAEEKIKLVAPLIGFNDDQIAAADAKPEGYSPADQYYSSVRKTVEETYPNYEVEWADWGWAETLDQKQRALIASGDAPDIVAGETFMPTYANEGILEPLPQDIVDMVNPSFLIFDRDGKAVAVAHKSAIFMLFYNKDLMTAAGLDPEQPPKTWAEFKTMSDAITKAGEGKFYGGGIPTFPHAGGALRATPFFRQMGTDFSKDGLSNLNDPKLQETLKFIREMDANFPVGLGNNSDEGPLWTAFEKDKTIAFVINGIWEAGGATANGINWGVTTLPLPEGGVDGNCMVGSVYNAVPKASRHKEEAFNLIRAALKEENQRLWIPQTVCLPLKSIIENTDLFADNPTLLAAMNALNNGTYSGLASFQKNDAQVWEIVNTKVLARTTMTQDSIETICQEADAEIAALLK